MFCHGGLRGSLNGLSEQKQDLSPRQEHENVSSSEILINITEGLAIFVE